MSGLTTDERNRYARHLSLSEVGEAGQIKLKSARVLIVGAGGLGCPAALYLVSAGVGYVGIMDHDSVSLSNLQRQVLFSTSAIGQPKADEAARRLRDLNPSVGILPIRERLTPQNARRWISKFDLVIDGTDNFATRYLINDVCLLEKKPFISGAIFRFEAQISVFARANGPCYRCLYPEPPPLEASPGCSEVGVLGVLSGTTGLLMGTEALKLILGIGEPLSGVMLFYDALETRFSKLKVDRRADCPACGANADLSQMTKLNLTQSADDLDTMSISAADLHRAIEHRLREPQTNLIHLIDVRSAEEFAGEHLNDSINIPLDHLRFSLPELSRGSEIITLCKTGRRSQRASEILRAAGFTNVRSLRGGLDEFSPEKGLGGVSETTSCPS